jgi:PAS domain S-box-containing protein
MGILLRVLIVEDSEDDTMLLERELRRGGYEPMFKRVDTATAMNAALDQQTWDIVISDYSMPQFSASAALRLLQEKELDLPFIIVSGVIGENTAVAAMKAGAHDFILKDNLARLVPAIERELRESAERWERRQAEEALRASEERFRLLVDGVKDYAIIMMDTDGRFVSWNAGAERILGYQEVEIIGQSFSCIFTLEDIQQGKPEQELKVAVIEGRAKDERWHVRKNGTSFWASGVVTPVQDGTGTLRGFSKVMRDETERKQAEEALRQQTERERLVELMTQRLRQSLNLQEILNTTVAEVRQFLACDRVFIHRFESDGSGIAVVESVAPGWISILDTQVQGSYLVEATGELINKVASKR